MFNVFLSHITSDREYASELKNELAFFGITSFVAHEDIHPTQQWVQEIETNLNDMNLLIALMVPEYKNSVWCGQEAGVAIGKNISVYSIDRGLKPAGFLSAKQSFYGINKPARELALDIVEVAINDEGISKSLLDVLVEKFNNSSSYEMTRRLINVIRQSKLIEKNHVDLMKSAYSTNSQISDCFDVELDELDELDRLINKNVL